MIGSDGPLAIAFAQCERNPSAHILMIAGSDVHSTWWKQEKKTEDIESEEAQDIIGPDPEEDEDDDEEDIIGPNPEEDENDDEEEMELQPKEEADAEENILEVYSNPQK